MKGFFVVHDPRFCAVTGADGVFEIKNIPPGTYKGTIFSGILRRENVESGYQRRETLDLACDYGPITKNELARASASRYKNG